MAKKSMIRQGAVDQGCQVCGGHFDEFVIDGRTLQGPWAYMCQTCHHQIGVGLGLGRGQKYDIVTLEKVEG